MNLREIIVGGLLLPLNIYFQPQRFRNEVAALAPELPKFYSIWQARHKLREMGFRQAISQLIFRSCVALCWVPTVALLLSLLGIKVSWLKVVGSVAFGVLLIIIECIGANVLGGISLSIMSCIVGGIAFSVERSISPSVTEVAALLGIIIGSFSSLSSSVKQGLQLCIVFGIVAVVMLSVIGIGRAGVLFSIGRSISFGTKFVIASLLINSHLVVYPIQFVLAGTGRLISPIVPSSVFLWLWRLSPVRWDENIILPLPGLTDQLVNLYRCNPELGDSAIREVSQHRFQKKAAFAALSRLANEEARQLYTLPALAGFERGLDWLDSDTPLADDLKTPLLILKDTSQAVDAALQSNTARNKISQLRLAAEKASSLHQSSGMLTTILTNWQKLITDGLTKAEEERRVLEPIRQVYFNDGKPISPDELPEEESPFKGRLETVRQLEAALTDGVRATLLLYGNRRSGKSSLLLQLPRKLGPQVLPAFLDCQSARFVSSDTASGLLIGLAEEIIEQARRNADKYRRDTIKFPRLDREAFNQDPYPAFDRWLKGAEKALGERSLLLCLDEFERLEEALATGRIDTRFLSMLRNIIQHHRRITVLLAGSHHLDELPPRWADALVTTQSLKIGFLDEADARELIVHPVKDFPQIYEPPTVGRIIELTHSQPYLVQLLCGLLVEKMNRERREPPASYVTLADVEAVIPLALERGEAYFIDLWRSQTGGNLARRVLEKLAFAPGEQSTSAEIKQLAGDEEELRETIKALLRREIIEPTEDGYRILVPLIARYVRDQRQPI